MKNKHFDRLRAAAKKYAKSWHRAPYKDSNGIVLYHLYPEESKRVLGWWDDSAFKLGSQVIQVSWIHPRMSFSDETESEAFDLVKSPSWHWLSPLDGEKIYKKIGKNKKRKRHILTRFKEPDQNFIDWSKSVDEKMKELRQSTDLVIRPSFSVAQLNWGRKVNICAPIEAIDEKNVVKMTLLVKGILLGKTTIEQLWGDYTYTKNNWIEELPLMGKFSEL